MMKRNLINRFYNQIVEKYAKVYRKKPGVPNNGWFQRVSTELRSLEHLYAGLPGQGETSLKRITGGDRAPHRHAINDKEVKEQVEAYLPGLEESEKYG
ncbi:MAG: hypothetical protein ACLU4N_08350 [Butyricimonas faecihominis]